MFGKILVAVDGSEHSVRALEAGARLAKASGAKLSVVTVVYVPPVYQVDLGDELEQGFRDSARHILADARHVVEREGVEADYRSIDGHPAEAVVGLIESGGFELVVLGRRGLHDSEDRTLGGVSERVLRDADCSVMLVR